MQQAKIDDRGLIRVFVYGTLKSKHGNNILLRHSNSVFLGYDCMTGPYRMYSMGGFPAVIDKVNSTNKSIYGEVWATTDEGLASLDLLEGNPNFFARRKLTTDLMTKRAWMYFINSSWEDELTDNRLLEDSMWYPSSEEQEFWETKNVS